MESSLEPRAETGVMEPEISVDPGQTVRGLMPAQRLFQRYTTKRLLGRGGMGVVWLAHDEKLDREVALKFVPEMLYLDPAARDDLKRETCKSLELTHPNIVRIYDFIEDEEVAAISMEYVDGQTLSRLRVEKSRKLFEPEEIERWLAGLCGGLDYAHRSARIVHRDLKPANIMLNSRNEVKITDFGIACSLMSSVTRVSLWSSSGGTMAYMSPQQMQGETPSPADDIYALGASLYELMTGKPPFFSGNIAMQVREMTPPRMAARRESLGVQGKAIPERWEATIAACLAKEPEDRPQSASEVMARLRERTGAVPVGKGGLETQARKLGNLASTVLAGGAKTGAGEQPVLRIPLRNAALTALAAALLLLVYLAWPEKRSSEAFPTTDKADTGEPVAVSAPASQRGGLMIKTMPEGATVALGGEAVETAPATFKGITPGKYPVKITLPDYEPVQVEAEIKANEFADMGVVTLVRSSGTLQITSSPEGSDYELKAEADGGAKVLTGKTPDTVRELPTGKYTLALKHAGWPDEVKRVEITRGGVTPVEWHFAAGTVTVTSTPPGASVYLGGRLLGTTPLQADAAPGDYADLQVMMDGYVPVTLSTTIAQGEDTAVPPVTLQQMVTELQLNTTPAGLEYAVTGSNGVARTGTTPATFYDLPAGDYTVALKRAGWADFSAPATLVEKQAVTIAHEFPEGTVAITSVPDGAEIFAGGTSLGIAPVTVTLPPGNVELIARMNGMTQRTHTVTVADGEELSLEFNMKSGGSSSSHHHRHSKKVPPSELAKIGNSIKTFFGGKPANGKTHTSHQTGS